MKLWKCFGHSDLLACERHRGENWAAVRCDRLNKKIAGTNFGDQKKREMIINVRACVAQLLIQLSSTFRLFVSREITDSDVHGHSGHHAVRKTAAGSAMRDFCMGFLGASIPMLHAIVQPVPRFRDFACFSLSCLTEWCATIGSACFAATLAGIAFVQSLRIGRTGLTVLLPFNSRRRRVSCDLLYIESPSPEIERAERVNALPCRFLKRSSLAPFRIRGVVLRDCDVCSGS